MNRVISAFTLKNSESYLWGKRCLTFSVFCCRLSSVNNCACSYKLRGCEAIDLTGLQKRKNSSAIQTELDEANKDQLRELETAFNASREEMEATAFCPELARQLANMSQAAYVRELFNPQNVCLVDRFTAPKAQRLKDRTVLLQMSIQGLSLHAVHSGFYESLHLQS